MFWIGGYEEVFEAQRCEKLERQMKGCVVEQKAVTGMNA